MKLTATSVKEILEKCLAKDRGAIKKYELVDIDSPYGKVVVDDVCIILGLDSFRYCFETAALERNKDSIKSLLLQLPSEFMSSVAMGGALFLGACLDNRGHQWGEQENVDELLALGKAIDLVQTALPMPYTLVMVVDTQSTPEPQSRADTTIANSGKIEKILAIAIVILSPIILVVAGTHALIRNTLGRHPRRKQ